MKRQAVVLSSKDWVSKRAELREASLLLSMDIEGDEYSVIQNTPDDVLNTFRIITLEIHALHMLWEKEFLSYFNGFVKKLKINHDIVHLHPNNGTVYRMNALDCELYTCMELTLLHKNHRIKPPMYKQVIEHRLDIKNVEKNLLQTLVS